MFRSGPLGEGVQNNWKLWSGTWESIWNSLLGITRLGRLVAWSGDLGSVSLVLVNCLSHFLPEVFLYLHRPRELDTGDCCAIFQKIIILHQIFIEIHKDMKK